SEIASPPPTPLRWRNGASACWTPGALMTCCGELRGKASYGQRGGRRPSYSACVGATRSRRRLRGRLALPTMRAGDNRNGDDQRGGASSRPIFGPPGQRSVGVGNHLISVITA